jgi:hypothetical protein
MLTAAYPIPGGHAGSGYGLGWYVQDFAGMRIEWHTGRWPPSTSALYARFPDHGLTLIVLANTDNLTVPFYGLGNGDVMHSALALVFYRHYLYPSIHGGPLPTVDWEHPEQIAAQLAGAEGPAREFLERELWAYRQAWAAAGGVSEARALSSAQITAFPDSRFLSDPFFTNLAGPPDVIEPIMAARTLIGLSRAALAWLALVMLGVALMVIRLLMSRDTATVSWALWLLAALFVGPIAPAVHWAARARSPDSRPRHRSLAAALTAMAGYSLAWTLAIVVLLSMGEDANVLILLALYLATVLIGLGVVQAPLLQRSGVAGYRRAVRQGMVGGFITATVAVGVLFAFTLFVDNRLLSVIPYPTSPYFWLMMGITAVAGALALWPLEYWLIRRGFTVWPTVDGGAAIRVPTLRDSWWMLLASVLLMIVLIGAMAALTG